MACRAVQGSIVSRGDRIVVGAHRITSAKACALQG